MITAIRRTSGELKGIRGGVRRTVVIQYLLMCLVLISNAAFPVSEANPASFYFFVTPDSKQIPR